MQETQIFKSDGENTVFDIIKSNVNDTTIKVYINNIETKKFKFLSPSFIVLDEIEDKDNSVKIVFELKEYKQDIDKDILRRLADLEESVKDLTDLTSKLMLALDNRVSIKTFNAWKALIESKVGLKVIQTNMTDVSKELINMTNHK